MFMEACGCNWCLWRFICICGCHLIGINVNGGLDVSEDITGCIIGSIDIN